MLFWDVGGAILIFRYVFRDPKVDLRYLALGAVLPNLIDKPLGTLLLTETFAHNGRIVAHTLLFSAVLTGLVLLTTRRGRRRRRGMAVAVGGLLHLLLDGMWTVRETFLWPAFGWAFPAGDPDFWPGLPQRVLSDPLLLLGEAAGLAYLVYLWRKAGLRDPERRRAFLATGRI